MSAKMNKLKDSGTIDSHCLVFWLPENAGQEGTISIVKIDILPRAKRKVGCVTKLWWNNEKGEKKSYSAKVLQFGNEQDLKIINVDAFSGSLIDRSQKVFPGQILARKKETHQSISEKLKTKGSVLKKRTRDLICQNSIFEDDNSEVINGKPVENIQTKKLRTSVETTISANSELDMMASETSSEFSYASSSSTVNNQVVQTNQLSLHENLSILMRNLGNTIYLYGNGNVINFLNHILNEILEDRNNALSNIPPFVKALYETCKSIYKIKVERKEAPPFDIELPHTYFIDGPEKVPLFQKGHFYVLPQQLAIISSKTRRVEDWKSYVKAVIHELYGDSAAWISACGTRNTVGIHSQLFDDLYEEICKRTNTLVKKSEYIYQVNHLASNKRRPKIYKQTERHSKEKAARIAKSDLKCTNDLPSNILQQQISPLKQDSQVHHAAESSFQSSSSISQPTSTLSTSAYFEKNCQPISSSGYIQENQDSSWNRSDFNIQPPLLPHHNSSYVSLSSPSKPSQMPFDNLQLKNFIAQCFMEFTKQSTPSKHSVDCYGTTVSHASYTSL